MLLKRIDENHIEYKGVVWTKYPDSPNRNHRVYYYHHFEWKETPRSLHRELYTDFVGEIPKGYHIHHIDGDTENNSISNLKCMSSKEHAELHLRSPSALEKKRKAHCTEEGRRRSSIAQKNRKMTEHRCLLCGNLFKSRCNSNLAKWCPDCSAHQTTNKGHRYFPKKWQIERFGEVKIDPSIDLTMIK